MKFDIKCLSCNVVLGQKSDADKTPVPKKCAKCGGGRISMVPIIDKERTNAVYDVFVTNKKTGITKSFAFIVTPEELALGDEERKFVFIRKSAEALAQLLSNRNTFELLKESNE